MRYHAFLLLIAAGLLSSPAHGQQQRVIVTSDGEIDDECSMVRFLLYANEWDIEGIVTSSSQYHWRGHRWAGDDWMKPYLDAYEQVHPNLVRHDARYPTLEYLRARTAIGNVDADKLRFFFIWEQDSTYQAYIRPHWGKYDIPTIISDQFWAIAYEWDKILPAEKQKYFTGEWMRQHILENHGPLAALYKAKENGDFRSEGDSPAFLHVIDTGLRNQESPGWGGWGGRYVRVRDNTWLDPVPEPGYRYPEGRWYTRTAWGRRAMREGNHDRELVTEYFKPMWRWADAFQNDFAARADWSVKSYAEANHPPVVRLAHAQDLKVRPGDTVRTRKPFEALDVQ